ncbi:Coiled-coil and C2 domain-containing protein 1B, partial [Modicella reniformis]
IAEAASEDVRGNSNARGIEFRQLAADDDFKIVSNSDDDTYDMLQSQLESQINMCTTTCAYYMNIGDKMTALEFHKLKKVFKADLVSLQSYRSHGKRTPAFHFQDVRFELEVGYYQEIALNDLSVNIVRAWDLSHKDVQPTDIEAYVGWDLGWPTENMPGAGNGKGTTPTIKRTSKPEFNFSKTLGIERTKPFQRFVERKKATFEVWHYRGLLWKDYLLGRGQIPLQPLLNHSEIHEIIPLLDPTTRRNTGGKIEVKLRLQRPLLKPEIVVKEEKWLVIDEFNSGGLGFPSPVGATSRSGKGRIAKGATATTTTITSTTSKTTTTTMANRAGHRGSSPAP